MPWTAKSFRKRHNKKLTPAQARKAAKIANAILRETGGQLPTGYKPVACK